MSNPASTRREIIVSSMADASLLDVIKEARERRDAAVCAANETRAYMLQTANERFVNDVVNAHIELESRTRAAEADDDYDGYSGDDDDW